jgi:UrcA family protein
MKNLTLLLAGLASLCSVPALADTQSIPVSFAGLDLTSPAGQATLNRRIGYAVRTICGTPDIRDLAATTAARECTKATMAQTQPRIAIAMASAQPVVQVAAVH